MARRPTGIDERAMQSSAWGVCDEIDDDHNIQRMKGCDVWSGFKDTDVVRMQPAGSTSHPMKRKQQQQQQQGQQQSSGSGGGGNRGAGEKPIDNQSKEEGLNVMMSYTGGDRSNAAGGVSDDPRCRPYKTPEGSNINYCLDDGRMRNYLHPEKGNYVIACEQKKDDQGGGSSGGSGGGGKGEERLVSLRYAELPKQDRKKPQQQQAQDQMSGGGGGSGGGQGQQGQQQGSKEFNHQGDALSEIQIKKDGIYFMFGDGGGKDGKEKEGKAVAYYSRDDKNFYVGASGKQDKASCFRVMTEKGLSNKLYAKVGGGGGVG